MVKKETRLKSLSQGRPKIVQSPRAISSKATRTLIRSHHTLEKQKAAAIAKGDEVKAASIARLIEAQGGIKSYQRASLLGQTSERGGDSSKILLEWLEPVLPALKEQAKKTRIRMLEVGALSTTNACSRSKLFEMERIDLNSQEAGIKQQDFMERPSPEDQKDKFDIISLSLVLNYVPDATGKGDMLIRTLKFLKIQERPKGLAECLPSLFLVLPAPCVMNSRYMDETKLEAIMKSLGYALVKKKLSNKLAYSLWRMESDVVKKTATFKKAEIRSGKDRNNFSIVLR
ncbi:putative methyltransferase-domain-containing protein [Calycina marina]|uniref:25S rRNA adenine-N(1) methyltransferase n=1 Tax=Calycina marina TaxID=1763456 RepID=A0A9P7ZCI8_9HELO|nr:putative methyltransferase-domain-containing protein [Calycina marina]